MTGELGSDGSSADGAFWLGEMWAFGSDSDVPNYIDGDIESDGPAVSEPG